MFISTCKMILALGFLKPDAFWWENLSPHYNLRFFFFSQLLVSGSYQCANALFPVVEQEEELEGKHSVEILGHVISLHLCVCNCCGSEHCFYAFMQLTDGVEGREGETLSRGENLGCTQIPWLIAFSIEGSGLCSALNKGRKATVILTAVWISWLLQWNITNSSWSGAAFFFFLPQIWTFLQYGF